MSTVDSVIYDELENLKQAVKELQAEVKALKGEPSKPDFSCALLRLMGGEVNPPVGFLKIKKLKFGDAIPLKLIDTGTGEIKQYIKNTYKSEMKALRIAVREYNKTKETV
jgi:hypothetical protein